MGAVKNLARGEYVVFHAHSHWKVLVAPTAVFLACVAAVVAWAAFAPEGWHQPWTDWTVAAIAAAIALIWGVAPYIRWACRTDTLTNYRLISREGVFARSGRDIPMDRVHAVTYDRTFFERILGAGTLTVQTAAGDADVVLEDVARVERRQLQIQEELLGVDFPNVEPDAPAGPPTGPATGPPTGA
jgi:uncharacterized membrane protein YdbT with pleckstrin-like domain